MLVVPNDHLPPIHKTLDDSKINWRPLEERDISVKVCTRHGACKRDRDKGRSNVISVVYTVRDNLVARGKWPVRLDVFIGKSNTHT
jgi:hypothetical protein